MDDQITNDTTDVSQTVSQTYHSIEKSQQKTSFEEFCIVNRIRPEVRAGFKVWLKGKFHHFDEDWARIFYQYLTRKL